MKHRLSRKANPASPSIIDLTEKAPEFTDEEIARARAIVRSLATASFAGLDEDRTIQLAVSALRS